MKVLLNQHVPISLLTESERGQVLELRRVIGESGVDVGFLEWWREDQTADVLHQLGPIRPSVIKLAHLKGWKVVMTLSPDQRSVYGGVSNFVAWILARMPLPESVKERLPWRMTTAVDHIVVGAEKERETLTRTLSIRPRHVSVIAANGNLGRQLHEIYEAVLNHAG